jgi:4'-phosphopantetheinyl transferase
MSPPSTASPVRVDPGGPSPARAAGAREPDGRILDAPSDPIVRVEVVLVRLTSLRPGAASIATLSEDERHFAEGIASRPRRTSFLAARLLLRELLAQRLGCPPAAVPVIRQADGRPRLGSGGIELSLSHPDGWIAVALSADCPVGVDAEPIRPLVDMAEVVTVFFPPAARAEFAAASPQRQATVFFRWWTRIEAAVKASGRGLDDAPTCFEGVSYESCDAVPGLASAVAARAEGALIVDWHVAPMPNFDGGERVPRSARSREKGDRVHDDAQNE